MTGLLWLICKTYTREEKIWFIFALPQHIQRLLATSRDTIAVKKPRTGARAESISYIYESDRCLFLFYL
jgi:hypothetical protein